MKISLCMIVKNEEGTLNRCLNSVNNFVDEIIIVDTGSTDNTKEIAKKFNAKIYDFKWCDDFAKARNYAFSKSTKDYILWLDADDYITKLNQEKFIDLKKSLSNVTDSVSMIYSLMRDEKGNTTNSLRRNRLVKRNKNFKWIGRIHEYLEVGGNFYHSDIEIWHDKHKSYTDRNLKIYQKMKQNNIEFSPRDQYYYANELFYNEFYTEASIEYIVFLEQGLGWVEDKKQATIKLVNCLEKINQSEKITDYILETFKWDKPHAELCCRLAECFMREQRFQETIFWYKIALSCVEDKNNMAISSNVYYTFIPAIQLCVCYSKLGDYQKAYKYNELASGYQPNSPLVEHNRKFLSGLINKVETKQN